MTSCPPDQCKRLADARSQFFTMTLTVATLGRVAQVLSVDRASGKLLLTRKKALLSSTLPLISSYSGIRVGQVSHGWIVSVQNFGCIVRFFGDVKGLVPVGELSRERVSVPQSLFYVGQVCGRRRGCPFCAVARLALSRSEENVSCLLVGFSYRSSERRCCPVMPLRRDCCCPSGPWRIRRARTPRGLALKLERYARTHLYG